MLLLKCSGPCADRKEVTGVDCGTALTDEVLGTKTRAHGLALGARQTLAEVTTHITAVQGQVLHSNL
jgi:hypothetical protein